MGGLGELEYMVQLLTKQPIPTFASPYTLESIGREFEYMMYCLARCEWNPFEELELASERYRQVSDLMAANVDQEGRIVCFWHHRYAVLTSLGRTFGQVDMMLDKRVVAMDLYDREHGTAYLETARRTVEFPGSPAEAAKALNVHRNTYFYRVNKIAELFFLDLKCGDDRLAVAFSTHVLASMGGTVLFDVDDIPEVRRRIMTPTGH